MYDSIALWSIVSGLVIFIAVYAWYIACNVEAPLYSHVIILSIIVSLIFSEGVGIERQYSRDYTTTKVLVSTQPSHTQIEGSFGGFLIVSGVINESRVYLLREEVEDGLYKDFEVKHEVYIREDNTILDKGKFVQHFQCENIILSYSWLGMVLFDKQGEECKYSRQEIVVPKGSVIKELNI